MRHVAVRTCLFAGSGLILALCCAAAAAESLIGCGASSTLPGTMPILAQVAPSAVITRDATAVGERAMPSWFKGATPSADAQVALKTLLDAASHGLDPQRYRAAELERRVAQAAGQRLDASNMASLDQALTDALATYLRDLHEGRLPPEVLARSFNIQSVRGFDPYGLILQGREAHRLGEALKDAAPQTPQYEPVRKAMNAYRTMGQPAAWQVPLPALQGGALRPGDAWSGLTTLAARLEVLGDLATGNPIPTRYEGVLPNAIRYFQARHGLEVDGVIGAATLAQLDISPAQRAHQMAMTLERMRWRPWPQGRRVIEVNVPEFMLHAYELRAQKWQKILSMRVIVGKATSTRTPLIQEDMRFIEFSPYWNVPPSIARGETLPKLRRDPGYFTRQGFEFVTGDGSIVQTLNNEAIAAVQRGEWRIRQRPGPQNALGDIKFIFPNPQNIYLHHTPTPQLFARARRDFSHGCVRVDAPVRLAEFVLQDEPQWTEDRIIQTASSGRSQTLKLADPVPVIIAYRTAVIANDGKVQFFPDIYQQDARLAQALGAH